MLLKEKYDAKQNIKTIENAEGQKTYIKLTSDGVSFTELQDSAKNVYKVNYNGEELSSINYPDGYAEYYTYDRNGFVSSLTTRSGDVVNFIRDYQGKVFEKNTNNVQKVAFEYKDGLLVKAVKSNSIIELSYDAQRRPVSVTFDRNVSLIYTYDIEGRRKTLSDSTGLYSIAYEYDKQGRIKNVKKTENQTLLNVQYHEDKVESYSYGDGSKAKYSFDSLRKITSSILVENKYSEPLRILNYTYDRYGRILEVIDNNQSWKFAYDMASQMVSFKNESYKTEFQYDSVLNRVYKKSSDETFYTYNELNQLKTVGMSEHISYDDNGNLILINSISIEKQNKFEYDSENKVKSSFNGQTNCTYEYDAFENLKSSNCDGILTEYLFDPFGIFGPDLIKKV